jgi:NADH-quinone oxidoreductase subunit H
MDEISRKNLIDYAKEFYQNTFLNVLPFEIACVVVIAIACLIILIFAATLAGFFTYIERKVAGRIQSRVGPFRVGKWGLLQFVADGIKLILKEDTTPIAGDRFLFKLAPYIVFCASFLAWVTIPYTLGFSPADLDVGIMFVLAVTSVVVLGILMAGWSSGNKWSLYGAMRSAAQIVSYEVPAGLTILGMLLIVGSLNLQRIVEIQIRGAPFDIAPDFEGGVLSWLFFRYPPFTIASAIILYVTALAETNRLPYDIPEAESEIVAGYHTEYSGFRFAIFFLAEYVNMFLVSMIVSILFFGGWLAPYGVPALGFVEGLFWLFVKAFFFVFLMMWIRWTLPRWRVDQLMDLAWKKLVPLAFVNLFAIGTLVLLLR